MSGYISFNPWFPSMLRQQVDQPTASRGKLKSGWMSVSERQRLPSDSIGTVFLTLSGIKNGCEAHVFNQNGDLLASNESTSGDVIFQLSVYALGNSNNNVRIFVASLQYENVDIQYTLTSRNSTIPFFQRIDRTYKNPT